MLNQDWLAIYNDALLILGLDGITTNADDSNRRSKIDRALNAGVVVELLEDHPWQFALTSYKSFYDPSLESEWGYSKVHGKPEDMSRLHGLYTDETMRCPLKFYKDEGSNLFSDYEILYIEYISSNLKNTVELWPEFFKRMVAAKLANDAGPSLRMEGADVDNARGVFAERKSSALSNDAAASPPMVIPSGSWNKSRNRSNGRCR